MWVARSSSLRANPPDTWADSFIGKVTPLSRRRNSTRWANVPIEGDLIDHEGEGESLLDLGLHEGIGLRRGGVSQQRSPMGPRWIVLPEDLEALMGLGLH
jgi:hypothetical protein